MSYCDTNNPVYKLKPFIQERKKYNDLDVYYKIMKRDLNTIDPEHEPEVSKMDDHVANLITVENKFKNR